jgi:hypothetical protein
LIQVNSPNFIWFRAKAADGLTDEALHELADNLTESALVFLSSTGDAYGIDGLSRVERAAAEIRRRARRRCLRRLRTEVRCWKRTRWNSIQRGEWARIWMFFRDCASIECRIAWIAAAIRFPDARVRLSVQRAAAGVSALVN